MKEDVRNGVCRGINVTRTLTFWTDVIGIYVFGAYRNNSNVLQCFQTLMSLLYKLMITFNEDIFVAETAEEHKLSFRT